MSVILYTGMLCVSLLIDLCVLFVRVWQCV